tara:strand:+ start:14067 stop:17372 length:3306 start_codon:yes stop_codon:yes gene_type:complete
MESLEELQNLIDSKALNPANLGNQQLKIMDALFKKGALTGYNNVNEMFEERETARENIKQDALEKANPGGKSNFGYVIAGDLTGSMVPYILDRKKLMFAARKAKEADNFRFTQSKMGKFMSLITEKTLGKRFKGVRRLFGRTADFFTKSADAGQKFVRSQAGRTELKSIAGGTLGAGGGAATFEIQQYREGLKKAAMFDLAEISSNEYAKMDPLEKATTAVMFEMKNALLYNTIGSALTPIVSKVGKRVLGKAFGLGGRNREEIKAAVTVASEKSIPLTVIEASKTAGGGFFSSLITGFPRVLGQLPLIQSFIKRERFKRQEETAKRMNMMFTKSFGPIFHTHLFGNEIYATIKANHDEVARTTDALYGQLLRRADIMSDPRVIPVKELNKVVRGYVDKVKSMSLDNQLPTPTSELESQIQNLARMAGKEQFEPLTHISPKQYLGLQESLNKAFGEISEINPNAAILDYMTPLRMAMERDLANIGGKNFAKEFLEANEVIKSEYSRLLSEEGQDAAQKYLMKIQDDVKEYADALYGANEFFSSIASAMTGKTELTDALRLYDDKLLTKASLAGKIGAEKEPLSKLFGRISNLVFRDGTSEQVAELKFLLNATGKESEVGIGKGVGLLEREAQKQFPDMAKALANNQTIVKNGKTYKPADIKAALERTGKVGTSLYKALIGRVFTDAYYNSFENISRAAYKSLKKQNMNLQGVIDANRLKITKKVFDDDFLDSHLPNIAATQKFGVGLKRSLKPGETFARAGLEATEDLLKKDIAAIRTGTFNYNNFADSIGYNIPGKEQRFIEMFGGGLKGKRHFKDFDGVMRILQAQAEVAYGDISSFLSRRLQLGGVGIITGGGVGGFLLGGTVSAGVLTGAALLGAGIGIGLAGMSPRFARHLLNVMSPVERIKEARNMDKFFGGRLFGLPTPERSRSFVRLINQISEEDPTAFDGKFVPEITEEQVIEYLLNGPASIPDTSNFTPKDINPKYRESFMPKTVAFENASPEDKLALDSYFTGIDDGIERTYANRTQLEQETVKAAEMDGVAIPPTDVQEEPVAQAEAQTEPQMAQAMPQQQNQIQYENIFPNDPLGAMIAKNKQTGGTG